MRFSITKNRWWIISSIPIDIWSIERYQWLFLVCGTLSTGTVNAVIREKCEQRCRFLNHVKGQVFGFRTKLVTAMHVKPSLPPGSHEHFTRQTIVYRIDLFPTPPPPLPSPSPFPPLFRLCLFTSTSKCHSAQPTTNLLLLVFPSCLSTNSTCFCVSWTPRLPSSVRNSCKLLSTLRNFFLLSRVIPTLLRILYIIHIAI